MSEAHTLDHAKTELNGGGRDGGRTGDCSRQEDASAHPAASHCQVIGVRFRYSARLWFFTTTLAELPLGSWVVVRTARGEEPARVVVAPQQMAMAQIEVRPAPIVRRLDEKDAERIERGRELTKRVVRRAGEISRTGDLGITSIAADSTFDSVRIALSYSAPDDHHERRLGDQLAEEFDVVVDMVRVGPRDETRLIGGLGKCGRTLCRATLLPVLSDAASGLTRNQDLPLDPSKITGPRGRLLGGHSCENEQYQQLKQRLPRLGQKVATVSGVATVVSLQVFKELVTVRYDESGQEETLAASELPGDRASETVHGHELPAARDDGTQEER